MSRYFALITHNSVDQVIVCDDPAWIDQNFPGTAHVETFLDDDTVPYCGPGFGHDDTFPERFAPPWVQPVGAGAEHDWPYPAGALVFHRGRIWRSTVDANVWEPGVSGWHDAPDIGIPGWVQPTGAHDAYGLGVQVTHRGRVWTSTVAANVWEPGVYGWEAQE